MGVISSWTSPKTGSRSTSLTTSRSILQSRKRQNRRSPWRGNILTNGSPQQWAATSSRNMPLKRSEEHTSELQSLMRISYAVFCLKKKKTNEQQLKDLEIQMKQNSATNKY